MKQSVLSEKIVQDPEENSGVHMKSRDDLDCTELQY